ncbi:formyl transferase [Agrobacterium vitis]|uniref:formyl transferase n=1 Tax=Agrobacterium vitis TaxID=373 RepID=UPI003D2CE809
MGQQHDKGAILVMTAGGPNPWMVVNALQARFGRVHVLLEEQESKAEIFRRRQRRVGTITALGQLATMAAGKFMRRAAQKRSQSICQDFSANPRFDPQIPVTTVRSINSPEAQEAVQQLSPGVILLVSTRLMTAKVLASMPCPVLNLHAGINPAYRGQMGGYWALAKGDRDNFGATVHLVDQGTDTGAILYQVRAQPSSGDFISTYPMLLTAAALPITCQAVGDALEGKLTPIAPTGPSALYFPPTLWRWLWTGLTKGIW